MTRKHRSGALKGFPHRCGCMEYVFRQQLSEKYGPHHERDCEMWTMTADLPTWLYLAGGLLFVVGSVLRLLGY